MSSTKPISLIVSITFFFSLLLQSSSAQTVVKASYWFPGSDFPVTDIDSSLFTHLFCAFADLNNPQTNQVTVASTSQQRFSTFTETVQRRNPSVKTLLSIGGGDANKTAFASMASNPTSRKSFIDSSITLARSYVFHGLDLDWETPANAAEMTDFGRLLQEWRSAVEAETISSGKPRLLLTAAVCYSSNCDSNLYPVQAVSNSLDWVNIMAYDFYGGWSKVTGLPASLYRPTAGGSSGDSGVRDWTAAGLPAKKVVLGFSYSGWAWTLANPNSNGYGAATIGPAITKDGGIRSIQLKEWIMKNGATTVHDDQMVGDYCYAGTTWIGYDSEKSIMTKVSYAKQKGLLGYFSWHVGADDNSQLSRAASQAWDTAS